MVSQSREGPANFRSEVYSDLTQTNGMEITTDKARIRRVTRLDLATVLSSPDRVLRRVTADVSAKILSPETALPESAVMTNK